MYGSFECRHDFRESVQCVMCHGVNTRTQRRAMDNPGRSNLDQTFSDVHLILAGTVRNAGPHVRHVLDNAAAFCEGSRIHQFVVAVAPSQDETFTEVRQWANGRSNVTILNASSSSRNRVARIATARNQILAWLHKNVATSEPYLIMADLDGGTTFRPFVTLRQIFQTATRWNAVSFHSDVYYDLWALRCPGKEENCWARRPHTCKRKLFTCLDHTHGSDGLFPVKSAFNGLAIYKLQAALSCQYPTDGADCEHVGFHACLQANGDTMHISSIKHEVDFRFVREHVRVAS